MAAMAEMQASERRKELIPRREVLLRAGFLLTGMRQELLSFPHSLPRLLVGKSEHEMLLIIKEKVCALLRDLAAWPAKFADGNWLSKIDADLLPAEEAERLRPMSGPEVMAEQARVKRRRARRPRRCASFAPGASTVTLTIAHIEAFPSVRLLRGRNRN